MKGLHWVHKEMCATIWGRECSCHVRENEQALLRVARAAEAFKNASKYMQNHTVWEELHKALKALPDGLLEVEK